MEKSKQEPTVPPKHVRRAEFYKRLRENCNDSQKQEKTILEEFKEIAKLSKEVDEKDIPRIVNEFYEMYK